MHNNELIISNHEKSCPLRLRDPQASRNRDTCKSSLSGSGGRSQAIHADDERFTCEHIRPEAKHDVNAFYSLYIHWTRE